MALQEFEITGTPGDMKVTVDGVERPAQEVHVDMVADGIPRVTIMAGGITTITGKGDVMFVQEPTVNDVLLAAADWIESLNVEEVAAQVESRMISLRDNPIQVTMAVIAAAAREASDG